MDSLLRDGSLPRLFLTGAVWSVILFLFGSGQQVPDVLLDAGLVILGFYFGSSTGIGASQKAYRLGVDRAILVMKNGNSDVSADH